MGNMRPKPPPMGIVQVLALSALIGQMVLNKEPITHRPGIASGVRQYDVTLRRDLP